MAELSPISFFEPIVQPPEGGFVSLVDEAQPLFNFDNTVRLHRADKYDFALGDDSPGVERLAEVIGTPAESFMRREYALKELLEQKMLRQELIDAYIRNIGGPQNVRQEDIDFIRNMPAEALPDPATYFEKRYAERVVSSAGTMFDAARLSEALEDNPDIAHSSMDAASSLIAHAEVAKNLLEEAEARYAAMGFTDKAINFAETLVPGLTWYRLSSLLENPGDGEFLLGNNIAQQVEYFYLLPVEEAAPRLKQAFEKIWASNPLDAMYFLQAMLHYGTSDVLMNNALSILDVAGLGGVQAAKAGVRTGTRATRKAREFLFDTKGVDATNDVQTSFKNMLKDVVRAAKDRVTSAARVLDASGDLREAAFQNSLKIVRQRAEQTGTLKDFNQIVDELFTIFDPKSILKGPKYVMLSTEKQNRIVNYLMTSGQRMLSELNEPIRVTRIEPGSRPHIVMMEEAEREFRTQWTEVNDAILNVRPINASDTIDNLDRIAIEIGDKQGDLFHSAKAAEMFADMYELPKNEYRIKQHGNGYYIEIQRTLDETNPKVRDALAMEIKKKGGTPHTLLDAWLGGLRRLTGMKNYLPKDIAEAMDVATYGGSRMANFMRDMLKDFRKFNTEDLSRFFEAQRKYRDPVTGDIGKFSKTQGDFELEFLDMFDRMPTEQESMAYWRYVQMNHLDLLIRNYGIYRDKARAGLEMFGLPMKDIEDWRQPILEGKILSHEHFVNNVTPHAMDHPFGVVVWDADPLKLVFDYSGNTNSFRRMMDRFNDPNENWTFIQLTPTSRKALLERMPESFSRVFKQVSEKYPLDYIALRGGTEFERSPLDFWQLPNRPGGHIDYAYGHFLKQPDLRVVGRDPDRPSANPRTIYYGDRSLMWFATESQGKRFEKLFNEARELYRKAIQEPQRHRRQFQELHNYLKENLPLYNVRGFARLFRDVEKGGAGMDVNTPFHLVRKGESINDKLKLAEARDEAGNLLYPNFQIHSESPHNPYRDLVNMQFATERGDVLNTIVTEGDVMRFEDARLLDALPTIRRALGQLVRNRTLEDLKFKAAEHFVAEFSRVLADDIQSLRRAPIKALVDGNFRKNVGADDLPLLAAAKNYRRAALSFLNIKDERTKAWDFMKHKIADMMYKTAGQKGLELVEPWLIKDILNPVDKLKNIAFHSKFAFNVPAMFQQAQQLWAIAGIEGLVPSLRGMAATVIQHATWYDDSPKFLQHLADNIAPKGPWNWRPEWFKESFEAMKRTGFDEIGAEMAEHNVKLEGPIFRTGIGEFFHWGEGLFRFGERFARMTAWNTAYLKWREAHPLAKMTDEVVQQILSRASMTAGDMARSGMATWQQGWLGIPTQFMSYQLRLMEQFWGKRLTWQEKVGLLISQGVVWGIPVGVGGTIFGLWPIHESWRETALARGWAEQIEDNLLLNTLNDGLFSVILEFLTGEDFDTSRLGPGGISIFKELVDGNEFITDVLIGVSGETIGNWVKSASPFLWWIGSIMNDEGYPITPQDWLDLSSNLSGLSHTTRAYYAISAGEYFTKSGRSFEMSATEGLMAGLLGILPERYSDYYAMLAEDKHRRQAQEEFRQEATKFFRLAWKEKDPELMETYLKRARIMLPDNLFTPQERVRIMQQSMRDFGDILEKKHFEFLLKRPEALEIYMKKKEQRDNQ